MSEARVLTREEEQSAISMALERKSLTHIARTLEFANDMAFVSYRKKHPLFSQALNDARDAACDYLEDDLLGVADGNYDSKIARVKMDCITRLLSYRNPAKYGQRVDVNVTQSLDLGSVLAAAQARLPAPERDVLEIASDFNELL